MLNYRTILNAKTEEKSFLVLLANVCYLISTISLR